MYKFYLNIFLLLCCAGSMAQPLNLVPNGSFEDTIDFNNGFFAPRFWNMTLGTPDYFTSFFLPPYDSRSTPLNYYGYQIPKNGGHSYVAIVVRFGNETAEREYLQIKLKKTLIKDSLYNISFWVSLPDSFHWACEQRNIGFAFSDTVVKSNFEVLDRLVPNFFSDLQWDPTNKIGWEKIYQRIKANGKEKYLIIGNFFQDSQTNLKNVGGGEKPVYSRNSYYYIDDVELYQYRDSVLSKDSLDTLNSIVIPNIFTPNEDGINDIWMVNYPFGISEIIIYNRWGQIIKELRSPDFEWDGEEFSSGVYFYKVFYIERDVKKVKTGTITLIR